MNIINKLLGFGQVSKKDTAISTPPVVCPKCQEKNNPSFSNCWKCKTVLKNQTTKTNAEVVEKIRGAILKGLYSSKEKEELDSFMWGRFDKVHAMVKELGAAYHEEQKIFNEAGKCDYPKQNALLDKLDVILSELREKLKGFNPPSLAKDQYKQIVLYIEDYYSYSSNLRSFLKQMNAEPDGATPENWELMAEQMKKLIDTTAKASLDALRSANNRWEPIKKYYLEEVQARLHAFLDSSKIQLRENLDRVGLSKEIEDPFLKYARKIVDLSDDVTKFTVENLALDKNTDNLVSTLNLNIVILFCYIAEKVGRNMGIPEKLLKFLCPAVCISLIERSEAFGYNNLDGILETFKDVFLKYEQMPHLLPEDNTADPLDTVFGNGLMLAVKLAKFDLEADAAKDKKFGKVIGYCHDKLLEMCQAHNVFSDEIKKLNH